MHEHTATHGSLCPCDCCEHGCPHDPDLPSVVVGMDANGDDIMGTRAELAKLWAAENRLLEFFREPAF